MSIADKDDTNQQHRMIATEADDAIQASSYDGTNRTANTHNSYSINTWSMAVCTFGATNLRYAYLNGDVANKDSDSNSVTITDIDNVRISSSADSTPINYVDGYVCHAAIWDVALVDDEISRLYSGRLCPLLIRPASLKAYWPLIRGLEDIVGGYDLTNYGATVGALDPGIIFPVPPQISHVPAALTQKSVDGALSFVGSLGRKVSARRAISGEL